MKSNFGSLCRGLLAVVVLWGTLLPANALDLVIKATVDETKLGFIEGEVLTLTFRINPAFVDTTESGFNGEMAVWGAGGSLDAPIFSWIGMTGVTGSFAPVLGDDSNSSLTVNNQGAMTVDISYESLGYLADGNFVFVLAGSFALPESDFFDVPIGFVDPVTYFMGYLGTYSLEPFGFGLLANFDEPDFVTLTAVELQIVPEPSSLLLVAMSLAGGVWLVRGQRTSRVTLL